MADARIAVVGTGANGAGIGADLARAGRDVTFIEQWPAHVEAMRKDGITVAYPDERVTTPVRAHHLCEVAEMRAEFDVMFMLVKAYDTRWASELVKPLLAPDGLAVGLQNGMSLDDMADIFGSERTLGGVIEMASNMFEPGVVERHTRPEKTWFAVGSFDASTYGREQLVVEELGHAGVVELSDDIRSSKWMKLVVNAAELVPSAILDLPIIDAANVPGMREVMTRAGKEAVRVAIASGARARPIFGMEDADLSDPEKFSEDLLDVVLNKFSLPTTTTTVLHDWKKGRRSEVDQINGMVAAMGPRYGVPTPVNDLATAIAHRIEAGELVPGMHNLDLLVAALGPNSTHRAF